MGLAVYAILYMFFIYTWLLKEIPPSATIAIAAILSCYTLFLMANTKKRADLCGWEGKSFLSFWGLSSLAAFAIYVILAC